VLAALLGELDAIVRLARVRLGAAARADRFARNWLPRIGILAQLKVDEMGPFASACPTRDLPILLLIWGRYGVE
jgi:hypothetical protein